HFDRGRGSAERWRYAVRELLLGCATFRAVSRPRQARVALEQPEVGGGAAGGRGGGKHGNAQVWRRHAAAGEPGATPGNRSARVRGVVHQEHVESGKGVAERGRDGTWCATAA